jgi:hypothetical protein
MNQDEKKIIKKISEVLPKIKEQDRGYLLGTAEQMAREATKEKEEE